jgi:hypothetical protein
MKYNQPFDQPNNPNAPYVDGNRAAGIQGSIVPAASVEFDQREVVEVINTANTRAYSDFSNTACAPPANTDLTQLRKAIEGFIKAGGGGSGGGTPNWFIDTAVTYKVHGTGADFPDLITAMEYLSKYIITQNGSVTLQLAGSTSGVATQFVYPQSVIFAHPNNDKISVVGAPMLATLPTTDANYACTGNSATARANDLTTNLATLRSRFATELRFPGANCSAGNAIVIKGKLLRQFDGILLTSDGATNYAGGIYILGVGSMNGTSNLGLAVCGFGGTGVAVDASGGWLTASTLVICGCWSGLSTLDGGAFSAGANVLCLGNAYAGITSNPGGSYQLDGNVYANGNGNFGLLGVFGGLYVVATGSNNHFYKNGWGVWCQQAFIEAVGDYGAGANANVQGSVFATAGSNVYITGSINVGTCSPAVNTVGNGDSYIMN